MKKVIVLLALLCCMVCSAVPVFADAAPGGVGRDDVLNGDFSTAETAQSGDDMKDAFNEYGGKLPSIIDEVKHGWEEVFSGLAGVSKISRRYHRRHFRYLARKLYRVYRNAVFVYRCFGYH